MERIRRAPKEAVKMVKERECRQRKKYLLVVIWTILFKSLKTVKWPITLALAIEKSRRAKARTTCYSFSQELPFCYV